MSINPGLMLLIPCLEITRRDNPHTLSFLSRIMLQISRNQAINSCGNSNFKKSFIILIRQTYRHRRGGPDFGCRSNAIHKLINHVRFDL